MMAHDPSLWAGGAALNALDDHERAEFEAHKADCTFCEAELAGFRETAARLGSVMAQPPPASMRASVMAMLPLTRQIPPQVQPETAQDSTQDSVAAQDSDGRSEFDTVRIIAPPVAVSAGPASDAPTTPVEVPYPASAESPTVASVTDLSSRRRFTGRMLLAAAVVAVAVAAGAIFFGTRGTTQVADPLRQCVTTATDQSQVAAAADSIGTSKVTLSASCGAALVQLSNVPAPPSGHTYQLWVVSGTTQRSVGVMDPDGSGKMPDVVAPLHVGDTAIGLTVEPTGGSAAPTLPMVVQVPLQS